MTTWGDLFDRAGAYGTTTETVREALAERRERRAGDGNRVDERDDEPDDGNDGSDGCGGEGPTGTGERR